MPLAPSRVLRVFRYAMFFNGVNYYVEVADYGDPTVFTVAAWFVPVSAGTFRTVASKNENAWRFGQPFIDGSLGFRGVNADGSAWMLSTPVEPYLGMWVYLVGVARVGVVELWVNGELKARGSWKNSFRVTGRPLQIGRNEYKTAPPYGYGHYFDSFIISICIYSRDLSPEEILWNYKYPYNPVRRGLVLWFHAHPDYVKDIDGDGILEWVDLSGHGNHGKIYGAQLVELVKQPVRVLARAR
jgi:hypothetical protein